MAHVELKILHGIVGDLDIHSITIYSHIQKEYLKGTTSAADELRAPLRKREVNESSKIMKQD